MQFGVSLGPCSGLSVPPMGRLCITDLCSCYQRIMESETVLITCPTREMDASAFAICRYFKIHLVDHTLQLKMRCVWARVKSLQFS